MKWQQLSIHAVKQNLVLMTKRKTEKTTERGLAEKAFVISGTAEKELNTTIQ